MKELLLLLMMMMMEKNINNWSAVLYFFFYSMMVGRLILIRPDDILLLLFKDKQKIFERRLDKHNIFREAGRMPGDAVHKIYPLANTKVVDT